ncbi:MAG: hypothetical protein AB7E37_08210 [Candidatus Altimarinota bacterium]
MKYQVTYKNNNKTHYGDFEADNYQNLLNFFDKIVGANVLEIREYVYENQLKNITLNDLKNQNFIFKAFNEDNSMIDMKIPLIKKNLNQDFICNFIQSNLKIDNKKIKSISFKIQK